MNGLFAVAVELQNFCDARGWRSCLIGGIAVQRWGEPRATLDVDVVLLAGFGNEKQYIDTLLLAYSGRIADAAGFARKNRVLLLKSTSGVGIDVSLAALPFEEEMVDRATAFSVQPGLSLRTCSAEDLLVLKLFALRPIDIRDAESVVLRNRAILDWHYIARQLDPLVEVKHDPAILRELNRLRAM
jgi:hypothetical protein